MAANRAAVVVGVNTTGELTPLESAVAAADDVAAWLKAEGYAVVKLTDAAKPVTAAAVKKAVTKFVEAGTYEQLVLYFSGHGYWKNNAELWLLSDAPGNADEAVSWVETIELARDSGIPHVVVVSDACRSIPNTTTGMRVRGSVVFPNNPINTRVQPKIDKLQASAVGAPAYEVALSKTSKSKTSVFTHCLREAYANPDADMVLKVQDGKRTLEVVPNRRLEAFLRREVPAVLSSVSVAYQQLPVIDVLSDDSAYIGQVRRPPPGGVITDIAPTAQPITVNDVARAAVAAEISPVGLPMGGLQRFRRGAAAAASKQLSALRSTIEAPPPLTHYESQTGFTVSGADVRGAIAGEGGLVDRAGDEHPNAAAVRIWPDGGRTHCSVAITFGDGSGTLLPALQGYIGHITVADGGVLNVSYVPSDNSLRWIEYEKRRKDIDKLRSAVSAAASLGTLRLRKEDAARFAERVRVQKQFDPTLGMYAAYAYAEAGLYDEVRSVREYMFDDLRVSLFDVAMLDRKTGEQDWLAIEGAVPFCPMLSQGWYYLRPRGVKLPGILENGQDELIQSLWTTFNMKFMSVINSALREGRLI
jgi:hypothetical protein